MKGLDAETLWGQGAEGGRIAVVLTGRQLNVLMARSCWERGRAGEERVAVQA